MMRLGLFPAIVTLLLTSLPSHTKAEEPLSFSTLRKLIETHSIKSIEDLLPLLPEQYRSRFPLIYKSDSAQGASPTQPRTFPFGGSGDPKNPAKPRLFMAMTGDHRQAGGKILETIEFDSENKKFIFRSIDFGAANLINEDPTKCMKCHSTSLHPIWDSYSLWPGAIGGDHLGHQGLHPENEREMMKQFLSNAANHERYQHLKLSTPLDPAKYAEALTELDNNNTHLSRILTEYNTERILAEVVVAPEFPKYRDAFEAALTSSYDFFSKLPDPASAKTRHQELLADTKEKTEKYLRERTDRYVKLTGVIPGSHDLILDSDPRDLEAVARVRLVVEDYLKLPTQDWSISRFPNTYAFTGPQGGIRVWQILWNAKKEELLRLRESKLQVNVDCSKAILKSVSNLTSKP